MIIQTLTYGELDVAALCRKNSLVVTPIRKEGRTWTDINGNEHITTIGWSYEVAVDLNPLTYDQAQALYDVIKSGPHTLVFQYAGLEDAVEQSSIVESLALSPTFSPTYCQSIDQLIFTEAY